MKLYDCATAPSPRRVRIFAAEKGIELDRVEIDLKTGAQFAPEFRALNPDCVVPVLELDDGTAISEVLAICQYLEELHPDPALFGQTAEQRAVSTMWNNKIEQHGLMHMRDAFRNSAKGLRGHAITGPHGVDQIPELAERGRQCVIAFFDRLEQQLESRAFITGDEYSIADITGLVLIDFARWIKLEVPEEAVNLRRWYGDVSTRPSAGAC
jgi:glutathione S-transferase